MAGLNPIRLGGPKPGEASGSPGLQRVQSVKVDGDSGNGNPSLAVRRGTSMGMLSESIVCPQLERLHHRAVEEQLLRQFDLKCKEHSEQLMRLEDEYRAAPSAVLKAVIQKQLASKWEEFRACLLKERSLLSTSYRDLCSELKAKNPRLQNLLKTRRQLVHRQNAQPFGSVAFMQISAKLKANAQRISEAMAHSNVVETKHSYLMDQINAQLKRNEEDLAKLTPYLNRNLAKILAPGQGQVFSAPETARQTASAGAPPSARPGARMADLEGELNQQQDRRSAALAQSNSDVAHAAQIKMKELRTQLRLHPGNVFCSIMDQMERQAQMGGAAAEQSRWDLIRSQHLAQPIFMNASLDFREQAVRKVLALTLAQLRREYEDQPAVAAEINQLEIQAFGSTNPTSDYDLSMSIPERLLDKLPPGLDTRVVRQFNETFREAFGEESGSYFDTNLYTRGLAPDIDEELGRKNREGVRTGGKGAYPWKSAAGEKAHNRNQDILSLVKQRKYMSQTSWDHYVERMLAQMPNPVRDEVRNRYREADALYQESFGENGLLIKKMQELKRQHPDMKAAALELEASNLLYVDKLSAADAELKKLQATNDADIEAKESLRAAHLLALGKALLFANEPYFSEGTLRHVVANEQALKNESSKLEINASQGLQSVNENFGDIEKELGHLHDQPLGRVAIKVSKYIGRFARAIDLALADIPGNAAPFHAEPLQGLLAQKEALLAIEPALLDLRAGNKPPHTHRDLSKEDYALSLLQSQPELRDITSCAALQALIEEIALRVNQAVRPGLLG